MEHPAYQVEVKNHPPVGIAIIVDDIATVRVRAIDPIFQEQY